MSRFHQGGGGQVVNCGMIFGEISQPPWSRERKKIHVTVANRRPSDFSGDRPRICQGFPRVCLCFPRFANYSALKTRVNVSSPHWSISFTLAGPARSIPRRQNRQGLPRELSTTIRDNPHRLTRKTKDAIRDDSELMKVSQWSRLGTDSETDAPKYTVLKCSAFHMASTSRMNELVSRSRGEKRPRKVARGARGWVSCATRWRRVRHCNSLQPLLLVTLRGLLLSTVSHCGDESDWPLEPSAAQVS